MVDERLTELLVEALETERGEVQIYETALRCAENEGLRSSWMQQAELASRHAEIVEGAVEAVGLDSTAKTTAASVVHFIEATLVHAMEMALESAPPGTAELVAVECVSFAEARDRLNWELLGDAVEQIDGAAGKALKAVSTEVTGAPVASAVGAPRRGSSAQREYRMAG